MRGLVTLLALASGACVSFCSSASNSDADVTVFGVAMKRELPFVECPFSEVKVPKRGQAILGKSYLQYTALRPAHQPCYERTLIGSPAPLHHESVAIKFPIGDEPALSKHGELAARLVNGAVERLWLWTKGLRHQDDDLAALAAKFGEPTQKNARIVSNAFGATFTSISAGWALSEGITVTYTGTTGTIDSGMLAVSTPVGEQSFQDALNSATQRGRDL